MSKNKRIYGIYNKTAESEIENFWNTKKEKYPAHKTRVKHKHQVCHTNTNPVFSTLVYLHSQKKENKRDTLNFFVHFVYVSHRKHRADCLIIENILLISNTRYFPLAFDRSSIFFPLFCSCFLYFYTSSFLSGQLFSFPASLILPPLLLFILPQHPPFILPSSTSLSLPRLSRVLSLPFPPIISYTPPLTPLNIPHCLRAHNKDYFPQLKSN